MADPEVCADVEKTRGTIDYLRLPEAWPAETPDGSREATYRVKDAIYRGGHLDVSSLGLTRIPEELGLCQALKRFDCNSNSLKEIPAVIFTRAVFSKLEVLWCNYSDLNHLPKEIGQCSALRELYCNDNALTELPKELGQCSELKIVHCHNNPFKEPWAELIDGEDHQPEVLAKLRTDAQSVDRRFKAAGRV